jgi:hypothetical protein
LGACGKCAIHELHGLQRLSRAVDPFFERRIVAGNRFGTDFASLFTQADRCLVA